MSGGHVRVAVRRRTSRLFLIGSLTRCSLSSASARLVPACLSDGTVSTLSEIIARHPEPPASAVLGAQLYERSARLVGMGAWSCNLLTERLTWTSGVFDLFGLPQ